VKKSGVLNQPLSAVIAGLGHTDMLVVADAGLPIPDGPLRIDLAVTAGVPPVLDVLQAILGEVVIESAILAEEIARQNPRMRQAMLDLLGDVPIEYMLHSSFKAMTSQARAVVRTGECTPFANVILIAGVAF